MDHYLDDEEQQLVEDFEKALEEGTLESAPNLEARKKELQQIARNTLNKGRDIQNCCMAFVRQFVQVGMTLIETHKGCYMSFDIPT